MQFRLAVETGDSASSMEFEVRASCGRLQISGCRKLKHLEECGWSPEFILRKWVIA